MYCSVYSCVYPCTHLLHTVNTLYIISPYTVLCIHMNYPCTLYCKYTVQYMDTPWVCNLQNSQCDGVARVAIDTAAVFWTGDSLHLGLRFPPSRLAPSLPLIPPPLARFTPVSLCPLSLPPTNLVHRSINVER